MTNLTTIDGRACLGGIDMTVAEWAAIADHPRQRDTVKRARSAERKHLAQFQPEHAQVNLGQLPDGRQFKLDGHTRGYLWSLGKPHGGVPALVHVTVWHCDDLAALNRAYETYDNRVAGKTSEDYVHGACREQELVFTSSLLTGKRFANGLKLAYRFMYSGFRARQKNHYDLVATYKTELLLLDSVKPTQARWSGGITAAAVLVLRRDGEFALEFLRAFQENLGWKAEQERDAIQVLEDRRLTLKAQKRLSQGDHAFNFMLLVLAAYEAFQHEKTFTGSGFRPLNSDQQTRWRRELSKGSGGRDAG